MSDLVDEAPVVLLEGPENGFGWNVLDAGDVDGDGLHDLLAAAEFGNYGLYAGTVDGFAAAPFGTVGNDDTAWDVDTVGHAAALGDVDGDGHADLALGGTLGSVAFYAGSAQGYGDAVSRVDGYGVALIGDVDGDGLDDVAVESWGRESGSVSAYPVALDGLGDPTFTWVGEAAEWPVPAAVGDVNGDGYADLGTGGAAPRDAAADGVGTARVFAGAAAGIVADPLWSASGDRVGCGYGQSITSGDVDQDGFSDLAVSEYYTTADGGAVFVYRGGPEGPTAEAAWTMSAGQGLGMVDVSLGDLDGDGWLDLASGDKTGVLLWTGGDGGFPQEVTQEVATSFVPAVVAMQGASAAFLVVGDSDAAGGVGEVAVLRSTAAPPGDDGPPADGCACGTTPVPEAWGTVVLLGWLSSRRRRPMQSGVARCIPRGRVDHGGR